MPNSDKLIKQGIKYTDSLFDELVKRVNAGVRSCDTLEEFLVKYNEYTDGNGENNPLVLNGYRDKMLDLILQETNNHKFSRPSQKELVRVTIENSVGELIVDVGEDVRESVREVVRDGYNQNLSQDEIATNISNRVNAIKGKRAKAIARTEIARTATISDYVINKERGATHFYVECRNTACPVCKKNWHERWTPENDSTFNPRDESAGGKGWIGDKVYSMNDTGMLPPVHPNCYDSETKVFTDNGWKYFKDVTETDKVLSLNPQTNETEFLEPLNIIQVLNIHGKLYHIHNKWFDVCVTPDHDCFIHQRRDGGNRGKYLEPQFRKPSELTSESRFVRCIDTDRENPQTVNVNGLEFAPEDYAFFMAWYISEGSVLHNPETAKKRGYPIKITQEIDANREIIEPRLKAICDKLGYRLAIGKSYYEIYSKQLYDYLAPLGYSHEKYIPSEVFTLNKECLNIFLDVYVLGDGHERTASNGLVSNGNERILFTSSKRLRDDLSYLILLCGYYPSIGMHTKAGTVSNHSNGKYVQNHDVYRISINKSRYTTFSSCTVDEVEYSGLVYCVELPKYHTLWVMRNGKASWNGNCRCVAYFVSDAEIPKGTVMVKDTTTTQTTTTTTTQMINDFDGRLLTSSELKEKLDERSYKLFQDYSNKIMKSVRKLEKLPEDSPQRLMHEARIKSAKKVLDKLEKEALNPVKKVTYPIQAETPQQVQDTKKEVGAKNVYSEVTSNKHTYDVYEFDGFSVAMDRELIGKNSLASVKEITDHIRSLPKELRSTGVRINISNIMDLEAGGYYYKASHEIEIFNNGNRIVKQSDTGFKGLEIETIFDVITHEMAHAYDFKNYEIVHNTGNIASKEVWGKICKEDDKLYKYRDERTGRMRTPRTFPTGYGSESWYKASRSDNFDKKASQYCEDFAESTKLYLNPRTHGEFVKQFPNRAKFLKELYGEPNFEKSIILLIE